MLPPFKLKILATILICLKKALLIYGRRPHLENFPDARPDYSSFTGEYCDANDDPSLEIRLNEDGSYLIQISIFREIGYDACIGSLSEEKCLSHPINAAV